MLLFDICIHSFSDNNFLPFFPIQIQKVKIKGGQKINEVVKMAKSNMWPKVQEMGDLHI